MVDATVPSLLASARRRVWRGEFADAARLASWGTISLLLFVVAVHLILHAVPPGIVAFAVVVLWVSFGTWAGLRRPSDLACALWADRHAGGASAFSTWVEIHAAAHPAAAPQAIAWLEQWITARVPHSLRALEQRREPKRLLFPLLATLACGVIAALVLALPDVAATSATAAGTATGPAETAASKTAPAAADVVNELAQLLHGTDSRRAPDPRGVGTASASAVDGSAAATAVAHPSEAAAGGRPSANARSLSENSLEGSANGAAAAPGTGSGRAAGDRPDERADAGSSRPAQSTMPPEGRASGARRASAGQRADMEQVATFDTDTPLRSVSGGTLDTPLAATPPAAAATMQLTPTQAAYVQAWMKANAPLR
jgi:hypothetical protein